jgi:hypothetical protein
VHRRNYRIHKIVRGTPKKGSKSCAKKRSHKDQDGSEIRSVELERLIVEGATMIERRNTVEFFRDTAADRFEAHTGSAWRPRGGSKVNHRALTAAMIDRRDYLAAVDELRDLGDACCPVRTTPGVRLKADCHGN